MPDLLEDVRRYGEAVEAAAVERSGTAYPTTPIDARRRTPVRRVAIGGIAASLVLVLVVVGALVAARDDRGVDRIETPPPPPPSASATSTPAPGSIERLPATELSMSTASWADEDPGPLAARYWPAAVWTGEEVLIWGGANLYRVGEQARSYDDGAAFDPAAGTWRQLPPTPLAARNDAVSAWTGSEMLIWGGNSSAETDEPRAVAFVDGAAFDPTANRWRVLPAAPLPPGPRYVGAWTGEALVVVGAADGVVHAARYDPAWSRWEEIDTGRIDGAPSMTRPAIHWTGTRVVVVDELPLGEPVIVHTYDPASGEWASSRSPEFATRALGTSVLDSRLVLVAYGGRTEGATTYDPADGRWGDIVGLGDLGCEAGPTVVGLADRAYVRDWCGRAGFFDPANDTWQPVTEPGSPMDESPPLVSVLTWTGSELVMWGAVRTGQGDGGDGGMSPQTWTLRP
jgi:hypothetical protein